MDPVDLVDDLKQKYLYKKINGLCLVFGLT